MDYGRGIGAGISQGIQGGIQALTGIEKVKQARQKEILTNLQLQKEREEHERGNAIHLHEHVLSEVPEFYRPRIEKMLQSIPKVESSGSIGYRQRDLQSLKKTMMETPGIVHSLAEDEFNFSDRKYKEAQAALEEYQAQGKDPEALKGDKKYQAIQQEAQRWKLQSQTAFQKVVGIQDRMKELEKNYTPDSVESWTRGEGKPVPRQLTVEEVKQTGANTREGMKQEGKDADRDAKVVAAAVKAAGGKNGDDEEKQNERYSKRDKGYRTDAHKLAAAAVKGMTGVKVVNGPDGPQIDMSGNADAEKKYSDTYNKAYTRLVNQAKKNKQLPKDWSTGEEAPQAAPSGGGQKVGYYQDDAGKTWYYDGSKWRYNADGQWYWGEPKQ